MRGDEPLLHHREQHTVAPGPGPVRMTVRCMPLWRLDDACHGRRLAESEIPQILAKERTRPLGWVSAEAVLRLV